MKFSDEISMNASKYTARPWSCKDFDEDGCRQQVLYSLKEHYNTAYDCVFLSAAATGASKGYLVAVYHSGDIRLFDWQRLCSVWLSSRNQQPPEYSWQGHTGSVYAVTVLHSQGHGLLLATAGDDGFVRMWKVADILQAAAVAGPADTHAAAAAGQLQAAAEVQLPHVQNPLGISDGRQPALQALAAAPQQQQLFIGASDGGVHIVDVLQLLALGQLHPAGCVKSLPGHAAAVMGLDYCAATQQLASASEDGTVRIWDCQAQRCLAIINPHEEIIVPPDNPAELLRCVRSPPVTCVKFDAGGAWLVAGCGQAGFGSGSGGSLTLWNCMQGTAAKHKIVEDCTPQVLLLTPGMVYMAGTGKQVHQFSFQLEEQRVFDVGAESIFAIAADSGSGAMAICGSKACIDVLSAQGATLGVVKPVPSVLTN